MATSSSLIFRGQCVDASPLHRQKSLTRPKGVGRPSRKPPDKDMDLTRFQISERELGVDCPLEFCVNIGEPSSVIERKELNRLLSACGKCCRNITKSGNRFRFGDVNFKSIGQIDIPLATPCGEAPINGIFDIIATDVPTLLEMDILDREQLVTDTILNHLAQRKLMMMPDAC